MEEETESFVDKHREYSILGKYPPFSISMKKRESYYADVIEEGNRIQSKEKAGDEDALERMFSTLEVKWNDDLEEARLYQKRYGDDMVAAQKAAIKLNGLDEDDLDVPLEP